MVLAFIGLGFCPWVLSLIGSWASLVASVFSFEFVCVSGVLGCRITWSLLVTWVLVFPRVWCNTGFSQPMGSLC